MDLQKGDPGGTITGTINDVPAADSKVGVTLPDMANQVGQNKIAVNFVWTLITGFLVMFMQAGFAMVESGLTRVKNANHTYMMNFFVYTCGLFSYWIIGFAIQMGAAAGNSNLGGLNSLASEHSLSLFGKMWGLWGQSGMFLAGHTYDVGVMVIFLFEMVFMDTALTIVTGACAERWKFLAFTVSSIIMGALTYPLYGNWAWGGGWLSQLGTNVGLGQVQPRRLIQPHPGARRFSMPDRVLHPGLRLVWIQPRQHAGRFGQRQPAHRHDRGEHHAGGLHGNDGSHPLHVVA